MQLYIRLFTRNKYIFVFLLIDFSRKLKRTDMFHLYAIVKSVILIASD